MYKPTDNGGFSLLEVTVVVVISVILASILLPNYARMANRSRLNGATRELVGDLMKVRMQCVSENKQFSFAFGGSRYTVYRDDNRNGVFEESEILNERDLSSGYGGVNMTATQDIVYNPRGTVSGATVTVANATGTKTIVVNIAGRVKVES